MELIERDKLLKTIPSEELVARMAIMSAPAVDAVPIEWLRSKYPLHGVYGTEDYFRKAHFVEQLIKEWIT